MVIDLTDDAPVACSLLWPVPPAEAPPAPERTPPCLFCAHDSLSRRPPSDGHHPVWTHHVLGLFREWRTRRGCPKQAEVSCRAKAPLQVLVQGCFSTSSKGPAKKLSSSRDRAVRIFIPQMVKFDDLKIEYTVRSTHRTRNLTMSDTPLTGAHTRGFPAGMNQRLL
jgi:hypothetical protein